MEELYGLSRFEAARVLWRYGHELLDFLAELKDFEIGFVGFRYLVVDKVIVTTKHNEDE